MQIDVKTTTMKTILTITDNITTPFLEMGVSNPLTALVPFPEVAEKWAHNEHCELILSSNSTST
jgi:hypothetical protein